MAVTMLAHRIDDKKQLAELTFGERDKLASEVCILMGTTRTMIRKVYTEKQLREFRRVSVNIITDIKNRRLIKNFLTDCIDGAKGSNIDVLFH